MRVGSANGKRITFEYEQPRLGGETGVALHNTSFVAYLSRGRVVTFGFGLRAALADAYETEFEAIAAVEEVGARNAHDVTELSER